MSPLQDEQVYIYKAGAHYTLVEGYPKSLKEELGIEGRVDAAFVCPNIDKVFILQGKRNSTVNNFYVCLHVINKHLTFLSTGRELLDIDLTATPRVVIDRLPMPLSNLDAALCGPNGVDVFQGSKFYHYDSPMLLAMGRMAPMS